MPQSAVCGSISMSWTLFFIVAKNNPIWNGNFSDGYDGIYEKMMGKKFIQRRFFWFLQLAKTVIVSNMKKKMPLQIFFSIIEKYGSALAAQWIYEGTQ